MTAPESPAEPVAVLVWRGDRIESRHRVAYAIADASGAVLHATGDPSRPVFPRSAVKPLQALALVESGAAARFAVGETELALACASHGGEPIHVDLVLGWLARLGLVPSALRCGPQAPSHAASAARLIAAGQLPGPQHNNCSGKHAGMLTLARHLGAPLDGYLEPDHPVQRRIAAVLATMTGIEALPAPAVDGCGVPTWPLPLAALATAMARLAAPVGLSPELAGACRQVGAVMSGHPHLMAGTGRACTAILQAAPGILVKTGAEGVYAAAWPARGLGLALKVEDGATRAAQVALLALLEGLGALGGQSRTALAALARPTLRNHADRAVGRIEPAPGWPDLPPRSSCDDRTAKP